MFVWRDVLGNYGPLWQSLDAVGRDNLLTEFASRSYVIVQAQEYILTLLHQPDHSLRRKLRSFAKDYGVIL